MQLEIAQSQGPRAEGLGPVVEGLGATSQGDAAKIPSGGGFSRRSDVNQAPITVAAAGGGETLSATEVAATGGARMEPKVAAAITSPPARSPRRARKKTEDEDPADMDATIEISVDDIGPEQVARMVKRRMLYLIPTSPTGNDISCLMKVVQVLPGWREGFVVAKQRADPDADVDNMTLEQASAEVERLMKIVGKAKG